MKKLLSIILAALLICSVMAPVTVFAENGPHPVDLENIDLENPGSLADLKMSAIIFMNLTSGDEEDILIGETAVLYPQIDGYKPSDLFSGASYNLKTNTLTLKNVTAKYASLMLLEMGDDFKINLIGYNELGDISSSAGTRGGSVTITGNGELVVNRTKNFNGITIGANETNSTLTVEDTVKLKVYADTDFEMPSIDIFSSACTNSAEIIKLGGAVTGNNVEFNKYTVNYYEQIEAYDLYWESYDWYEFGLEKDGVYYIADEYYDESTYNTTGKYEIYALSYDEILDCYTLTPYNNGNPVSLDGFTVLTEYAPIYDKNLGYYIGFTDEAEEGDKSYKCIFDPEEKTPFNICVDENGTKYGFEQYSYEEEDENGIIDSGVDTYVYNFIEHPVYGLVAVEDENRNSLDGLTPLKIGEKDFANASIYSDVVINNGGSVVEPGKIKGIELKNTNQGIKVSWKANSKAETYRVYRKAEGDKDWTIIDTVGSDETFIYDNSVKGGTKYFYTVRGFNYVGGGDYNKDGIAITHLDVPKAAAKNTSKGIYLKWTKIAGAEKYRIYRQTNGSTEWKLLDTTKKNTFTDKTAKSGTKYNYRVRAVAGDDMSSFATVGRYYLSTPKLTSVNNASSGVKVNWEKVKGAQGYKIYRKTSEKGNWKLIDTTTNNKKFYYVDKTAENGKTYYYSVQAYYSKTNSTYNQTGLKKKFVATPDVKTKEYSKSIKLSWDDIDGADKYAIYKKESGKSEWKKITTTRNTTYKDTAVKKGKTYSYRVRAIDGKTLSGYKTKKVVK